MKPHIKRVYGIWHCYGDHGSGAILGFGYTAWGAYCDWRRFGGGEGK